MYKAYKYRLYPSEDQKKLIDKTIDICRLVYNIALETKIRAWDSAKKNLTGYDLQKQLTELKKEYPWMSSVDSQALNASVLNVETAFKCFFNGAGYPKYKRKYSTQSFKCSGNKREVDWDASTLTIPKIAKIPIVISRRFHGQIKHVTIIKKSTGKYFASVLVLTNNKPLTKANINSGSTLGIDVGIKSFVITSDGRSFKPNRFLKNSLKRLQCLQKRASKKCKGSKNRKKATQSVARLHEKITNQRADYMHKITTELISDNQANTFVIEDLYVAGMLKNRKLSQAISDASFGEFFRQMKYKCEWYGKNLIIIDRFAPSSKRCSDCGEINELLTLLDRDWTCKCGSRHNRDINAAKNIKWYGLNNSPAGSWGGPAESRRLRRAKKQENIAKL